MFGREYLEVLELFPASDFAADLCAGFRDYRVVICASSFRKVIRRLDDLRARLGFFVAKCRRYGGLSFKAKGIHDGSHSNALEEFRSSVRSYSSSSLFVDLIGLLRGL